MSGARLPCPFCGGQEIAVRGMPFRSYERQVIGGYFAACVQCSFSHGSAFVGTQALPSHAFKSADEAIAAWNTRTSHTIPVAALRELVTRMEDHVEISCQCWCGEDWLAKITALIERAGRG